MAEAALSIGQVAAKAGVNASAIRYYERHRLLPEPERVSGQRRYTDETVQRLGIIDVAKQAGFSLDEVRVLLASTDQGAPAHEQLQALAARKLPEVDALIERAQTMRQWLTAATACGCDTLDVCALFTDPAVESEGRVAERRSRRTETHDLSHAGRRALRRADA
jgi:MerR family transcriptional regulator, redox-sensitive transcriptional activator SoxR